MRTLYKTLAEVKLLHEFYLTGPDSKTVFHYSTQEERFQFLENFLMANRPSITGDIDFIVPEQYADTFRKHKLHLVPFYSGFRIAAEVEEVPDDDSVLYRPVTPLTGSEKLIIGLRKKNSNIVSYSSQRLSPPFDSIYLFTNNRAANTMVFPNLSSPIPASDSNDSREQGELSVNGGNIQAFFTDENGSELWLPVPGNGYVNENDRVLIARRFSFAFPKNSAVASATFRLTDVQGNEIQSFTTAVGSSGKVILSFDESATEDLVPYHLEVQTPQQTRNYCLSFFGSMPDFRNYWAIICLVPRVPSGDFNLIDDDGFLRIRKNPDGTEIQPEFFEIRVKSRPTFWRYSNEHGKKLKANTSLDDYLIHDDERGVMISRTMRYASVTATPFEGNGNTRILPQPSSFNNLRVEGGRILIDVPVPRSDLFDI